MGQKVTVNIIRTDSRIKPGSLQLGKEGSLPVELGNDKDDDSEEDLKLLEQAKEMAKEQQHEQQKKVIMSKSTSANEVLKFPFHKSSGVHDRFVDEDEDEEEEKKNDIWSTTISKAAV